MFRGATKGPIVPPEQNWAIGYIVDRVYNSWELTLDENLILLPDLIAYKEKSQCLILPQLWALDISTRQSS